MNDLSASYGEKKRPWVQTWEQALAVGFMLFPLFAQLLSTFGQTLAVGLTLWCSTEIYNWESMKASRGCPNDHFEHTSDTDNWRWQESQTSALIAAESVPLRVHLALWEILLWPLFGECFLLINEVRLFYTERLWQCYPWQPPKT